MTLARTLPIALLLGIPACAGGNKDIDAAAGFDAAPQVDAPPAADAADTPDAAVPDAVVTIDAAPDADLTDADTTDADTTDADLSGCDPLVDLFPVPVSTTTSPFPSIDDAMLEVAFTQGFTFSFYGQSYTSVFLNTNAGMTFGAGDSNFDVAAADVTSPGIAVMWGDMDAAAHGADTRPDQMVYRQCADRFVITYTQLQDNDDSTWNNTATATLRLDGTIEIVYGQVLSQDILVGVFDGTHTADSAVSVQASYDLSTTGSGAVLFNHFGGGASNTAGLLDGQTITFVP